ncbi:MAG: hypothetical protein E7241_04105 [Lachnospiraceae bacterium]|jgi:flagellar protein FliO/FliZ|nr:hypothetical protein [Lachnospiraceae bacterium]
MLLAITVSSTLDNVLQFIGLLLLFVFILGATYFTTRWIANYQRTTGLNRNIKVIETYKLTTNKYIQIIQLGEKILAISVTKDRIEVLAELSEEEITFFSPENQNTKGDTFANILEKIKNRKSKS